MERLDELESAGMPTAAASSIESAVTEPKLRNLNERRLMKRRRKSSHRRSGVEVEVGEDG